MKHVVPALAFLAAVAPIVAAAASIDASLIPDGTYNAKVTAAGSKGSVDVTLENGASTTLKSSSKDFSSLKAGQSIKFSIIKGDVKVFMITG